MIIKLSAVSLGFFALSLTAINPAKAVEESSYSNELPSLIFSCELSDSGSVELNANLKSDPHPDGEALFFAYFGQEIWSNPFAVINKCKALATDLNSGKKQFSTQTHNVSEYIAREADVESCVQKTQIVVDSIVLEPTREPYFKIISEYSPCSELGNDATT